MAEDAKDSITDSMDMHLSELQEAVQDWRAAAHGATVRHDLATEQQQHTINLSKSHSQAQPHRGGVYAHSRKEKRGSAWWTSFSLS